MRTLLTGFDRFADVEVNPTQLIVEHIKEVHPANDLIVQVLPTKFVQAGSRITQLIREYRPERVICLGVGNGFEAIHLERIALNLDDSNVLDNAGLSPVGKLIVPTGPLAYWSTLPIENMRDALKDCGIPVIISNHAGTYVCNHVFYLARHEVELLEIDSECGFIHVPRLAEEKKEEIKSPPGLTLTMMTEAIKCCLRVQTSEREPGEGPQ
jgi:pyroglutamyl-peptidase